MEFYFNFKKNLVFLFGDANIERKINIAKYLFTLFCGFL